MELSKAPRLALTSGCGFGCVGTSVLGGGGAAGGRGGGGGAGGIDDAPVELRREDVVWLCQGGPAAEDCGCLAGLGQSCTSHVIPWMPVECEEQNRWKMPVIKSLYLQVSRVTWDTAEMKPEVPQYSGMQNMTQMWSCTEGNGDHWTGLPSFSFSFVPSEAVCSLGHEQ